MTYYRKGGFNMPINKSRRAFLQTAAVAATAAALGPAATAQTGGRGAGVPTRRLGKTGVQVSMLCLGGWHIGAIKTKAEAIRIMHAALDEGITFFDNAWDY